MAGGQRTKLSPSDIAQIAQLPSASTIGGGINALNQAAFGNPVAPIGPFGIVPTAPMPAPVVAPPAPVAPPPQQQQPTPPLGNGLGPGLQELGTIVHPGSFLPGGGFQDAGPRGDRNVLPVGKPAPSADHQQAILRMFGLDPSMGSQIFPRYVAPTPAAPAPKPATPAPVHVPATPQHVMTAAQTMGIPNLNMSTFGRALQAPGHPQLTTDGLQRITNAYNQVLAGNPANAQAADNMAMSHLAVERALSPLGGASPIALGGGGNR